jgi:hypothetical protein
MAWSVDRLGRSLKDLVAFLGDVHAQGVDLYLDRQGIDTTTPGGKALFQMMGVFAEFERAMIRERVCAGLDKARAKGKRLGRPHVAPAVENAIRAARAAGKGAVGDRPRSGRRRWHGAPGARRRSLNPSAGFAAFRCARDALMTKLVDAGGEASHRHGPARQRHELSTRHGSPSRFPAAGSHPPNRRTPPPSLLVSSGRLRDVCPNCIWLVCEIVGRLMKRAVKRWLARRQATPATGWCSGYQPIGPAATSA